MSRKNMWIVTPLKEDLFTGFYFSKKTKCFEFFPEIDLIQLKKQRVYLVLDSQVFLADLLNIPGKVSEFIKVQAENRVKESGVFLTTPKVVYKVVETLETTSKVFVFGIEEKDINNYLEKLKNIQAKIELITHKVLCIFCCFQRILFSDKMGSPVLLVLFDKTRIWYIVASKQALLYVRFTVIDEFLGISSQTILENVLMVKDYVYRFFQEDLKGLAFLGKGIEQVNLEEILRGSNLPLINFDSKLPVEVMEYPEFFGATVLDPVFNFLPFSEKLFLTQINWVERLMPVFWGLTGINLLLGLFLYKHNLELQKHIDSEVLSVKKIINELSYRIPETSLPKIKTYLELEKEKRTTLRLDEFLLWLSQIWDSDFILKNVTIGNNKIIIEVEIKGELMIAQKRAEELISHFEKHFKTEKSSLNFSGKENKGILKLEAVIKR